MIHAIRSFFPFRHPVQRAVSAALVLRPQPSRCLPCQRDQAGTAWLDDLFINCSFIYLAALWSFSSQNAGVQKLPSSEAQPPLGVEWEADRRHSTGSPEREQFRSRTMRESLACVLSDPLIFHVHAQLIRTLNLSSVSLLPIANSQKYNLT